MKKKHRAVLLARFKIGSVVAGIWRWSNDIRRALVDLRDLGLHQTMSIQIESIMSFLLLCVTKIRIISSIVCPSFYHSVMFCFCWHHKATSDTWSIITLNFTEKTFVHLSLNNICIYLDVKLLYDKIICFMKKKFGLTKFCSVWQNLEFCQTDVWQNSRVFRQHCRRYQFDMYTYMDQTLQSNYISCNSENIN